MAKDRFTIVFDKLSDTDAAGEYGELVAECRIIRAAGDEIWALRQLVDEISEPEPKTYTST